MDHFERKKYTSVCPISEAKNTEE